MNILITGIAGFFGQNLSRVLIADGHTVYGIDDLSIGTAKWLPKEAIFFRHDMSKFFVIDYIFNAIKSLDLIIHTASRKIPRDGKTTQTLLENVEMMSNICILSKAYNARMIFFSTSDIYGQQMLHDEEGTSRIGHPSNPRWSYAITKMWCEQLLFASTLKFMILRIFGTYGQYQAINWTAGPHAVFIDQALRHEPYTIHGDGTQTRCFTYVDDMIDGIIKAIYSDYDREIINLGSPNEEITIQKLAMMVHSIINPGIKFETIKVDAIKGKNVNEDVMIRKPIIVKAKIMLDWEPKTSLLDGLKKTIEWQKTVVV